MAKADGNSYSLSLKPPRPPPTLPWLRLAVAPSARLACVATASDHTAQLQTPRKQMQVLSKPSAYAHDNTLPLGWHTAP
jgi:hypothetical protein